MRLSQVLMVIALTTVTWLALDIFLIYSYDVDGESTADQVSGKGPVEELDSRRRNHERRVKLDPPRSPNRPMSHRNKPMHGVLSRIGNDQSLPQQIIHRNRFLDDVAKRLSRLKFREHQLVGDVFRRVRRGKSLDKHEINRHKMTDNVARQMKEGPVVRLPEILGEKQVDEIADKFKGRHKIHSQRWRDDTEKSVHLDGQWRQNFKRLSNIVHRFEQRNHKVNYEQSDHVIEDSPAESPEYLPNEMPPVERSRDWDDDASEHEINHLLSDKRIKRIRQIKKRKPGNKIVHKTKTKMGTKISSSTKKTMKDETTTIKTKTTTSTSSSTTTTKISSSSSSSTSSSSSSSTTKTIKPTKAKVKLVMKRLTKTKRKPIRSSTRTSKKAAITPANTTTVILKVQNASHIPNKLWAHRPFIEKEGVRFYKILDYDMPSKPRNPNAPGERGQGVFTSDAEEPLVEKGWKAAKFNQYVSDKISLERALPDPRDMLCKTKMYPYRILPKTSIIMCFTEESWSTLLRSVHSILIRTPPHLLVELILVDDFSQRDHLKDKLHNYLKSYPKVRLLRLKKRHGLIRARLEGARIARGEVLTFLDSHIECTVGWLEPLLERIWRNRNTVVSPVIDGIEAKDFSYTRTYTGNVGSFNWKMEFIWAGMPDRVKKLRKDKTSPIPTATIAGGLFSIDKKYFYKLGTYDPGLEIWGGENLELSFKVWMCGGRLEIIPCSRVGHVFRDTVPYKYTGDASTIIFRNWIRIAETFLGEYKDRFYMNFEGLRNFNYGDVTDRKRLLKKLGCKDFKWYLQNVVPEMKIPKAKYTFIGEIRLENTELCLDSMGPKSSEVALFECHGEKGNQRFYLRTDNTLGQFDRCVHVQSNRLRMDDCDMIDNKVTWIRDPNGQLQRAGTDQCLSADMTSKLPVVKTCNPRLPSQKWTFTAEE